jgi:hypothetical protein
MPLYRLINVSLNDGYFYGPPALFKFLDLGQLMISIKKGKTAYEKKNRYFPFEEDLPGDMSFEGKDADHPVREDDKEGNTIDTDYVGYLDEMEIRVLAIAQKTPWKTGQQPSLEVFQKDPETGCLKYRESGFFKKGYQI